MSVKADEYRLLQAHWNFYVNNGAPTTGASAGNIVRSSRAYRRGPVISPANKLKHCINCGRNIENEDHYRGSSGASFVLCLVCAGDIPDPEDPLE